MQIAVKNTSPTNQQSDCLVIAIFKDGLSNAAQMVDDAANGYIKRIIKNGDISGKAGETLLLQQVNNIAAKRILLLGAGKKQALTDKQFKNINTTAIAFLNKSGAKNVHTYLADIDVENRDTAWKIKQATLVSLSHHYRFDQLKTKNVKPVTTISSLTFNIGDSDNQACAVQAVIKAQATANGMELTKNLANLPANICNPAYLADQADAMSKTSTKLETEILNRADCEALKMGSFLSVSDGAAVEPKLIVFKYNGGAKDQKPVVLVGKGVTFDSGGISLKAGAAMDEMKYDMCGAASVFGVMQAIVEMQLNMNVVGIVPATENMPSSKATRPGDIVTSMSGQTIEVLNTDAEGRLILCDALTYAERFDPHTVIDIATLTGACIIALGHQTSAVMSNHSPLVDDLKTAGKSSCDPCWELPIGDEYQSQLNSNFADMANIGGRAAGSITAACFLARYTKKYNWAHLDIAGTAWVSGKNKGATGRPVPLLLEYLLNQASTRSD